ncbi:MAG: hypothetical protein ACT4ON_01530 [Bacteroidota bacterium]
MTSIINILLILCLTIIVVQDFKQREISWMLIPLTLAGFTYKAMNGDILLKNVLLNIAFIVIQLLMLTIYMSIKNKKPVNIINTYLGLGDILFFLVICVAFSPINFIAFYLSSMITTLIGVIIYNRFSNKQTKDIPLAGAMATGTIVLMVFPGLNFYNDVFLLEIVRNFV